MAIFTLPLTVSAGLVSALNSIFSKDDEYLNFHKNVQQLTLLASTVSPGATSQSDNIIVDESALGSTGGTVSNSSIESRPTSDQISIYTVREGDTLSQIAEMFNVTVNTIKWNNDIRGNTVRPGDTLVILPISGVRHTVKKGDTLASIAKQYKGDRDEIAGYNGISGPLAVGTVVIIPDGEITPVSGSVIAPSTALKEYVGYYLRPVAGGRRTQGIHGYNGVDLAASAGTAIMAAADGEVIISKNSGWNGGYGSYIVLKHSNGTQTLYSHLQSTSVSVGDSVRQGETIGFMGATGKATGVHLHFEIRGAKNPF